MVRIKIKKKKKNKIIPLRDYFKPPYVAGKISRTPFLKMFFTIFLLTATMAVRTYASNISNLMLAVKNRNIDEVKELLDKVDVTSKDPSGLNVLHAAAYSTGEITRLLMSHGADRVVNEPTYYDNVMPLFHACQTMRRNKEYSEHMYEILEAMLKAGGDPNAANSVLITPLHLIQTGPEARLLMSHGANVNAKDVHGYTPVGFLMKSHRINHEALYAFAEGNADFTVANDFGDTIFHMKTEFNEFIWTKETVTFFAQNGVPLDDRNYRGETALTKCLKRDMFLESTGMLSDIFSRENLKNSFYARMAEAGANLNAANESGETLLHLAVLNFYEGMAEWLLERGADADVENADGDTPLLALLKREKRDRKKSYFSFPSKEKTAKIKAMIRVLVEGGADARFKDESGRDAADYLRKSRMPWVDWDINESLKRNGTKKRKIFSRMTGSRSK